MTIHELMTMEIKDIIDLPNFHSLESEKKEDMGLWKVSLKGDVQSNGLVKVADLIIPNQIFTFYKQK